MSDLKPSQQGGTQTPTPQTGQSEPPVPPKLGNQQQGSQPLIRDWASI